jgi:hypothetical protein
MSNDEEQLKNMWIMVEMAEAQALLFLECAKMVRAYYNKPISKESVQMLSECSSLIRAHYKNHKPDETSPSQN